VTLDDADFEKIELLFKQLEREGAGILQKAGGARSLQFERALMMRFVGQGAETALMIDARPFAEWKKTEIREAFDNKYKKLYGRTYPESQVEFVTFKVRASRPGRPFELRKLKAGSAPDRSRKGERPAFSWRQKGFIPHTVYERTLLTAGARITGPAIIEERESTIVIGEDAVAKVDEYGFVWIDIG
jgi:N-methylhydantoinase A